MFSLIVAISKNRAIGKDNKLIFNIKEDLNFFKKITMSKTIIMGRKTFESLPGVLPGRKHIVLTRDENYKVDNSNVEILHSINDVFEKYKTYDGELFFIGGGEIYRQAIKSGLIDKMYITEVDEYIEDADTFFPNIDSLYYSVIEEIELTDKAKVFIYQNNLRKDCKNV